MTNSLPGRKKDHIRIAAEENVLSMVNSGLEDYRLIHCALPEISLLDVDSRIRIFGKDLSFPFLISSMTGGTTKAGTINHHLAKAAQKFKIAMGVGSQRAGIENPDSMFSYQVRKEAPDILLFANLGAVQLNYEYSIEQCKRAVDSIQADALILHLNPLQEALQPEGDIDFSGLLKKIDLICAQLPVPVVVKEVGWGISIEVAQQLKNAGVSAIDVAGAGGTSWSQVEKFRIADPVLKTVAGNFVDWGIPTAESISTIHLAMPNMVLFASGGLKSGIDAVKCIALGASLAGFAGKLIKPAIDSYVSLDMVLTSLVREFQIAMFACGAKSLKELPSKIEKIT